MLSGYWVKKRSAFMLIDRNKIDLEIIDELGNNIGATSDGADEREMLVLDGPGWVGIRATNIHKGKAATIRLRTKVYEP
jgi:hypothetical protein